MGEAVAIGIDLGTTFSCVAVRKDGLTTVCPNTEGSKTTPSWVWYGNRERLVGQLAKNKAIVDIEGVVYDAKRCISRNIDDEAIQADREKWPFTLVEEGGHLKMQIKINNVAKSFYPHEISGTVLDKMKKTAEKFVGKSVEYAVITVPAYFNDAQRQATIMAASLANLKVLNIINEPTAAAFAYNLAERSTKDRTILVYDLGGGTFDVSILKISGMKLRVLATNGDNHLGGEDFDNNLVNYCLTRFEKHIKRKIKDLNETEAKVCIRRLKHKCETAKIDLSSMQETKIEMPALYHENDFNLDIPRTRFESLNQTLFDKTMEILDRCLEGAHLKPEDIEYIVLVGGSTRIPMVQKKIAKKFPKSEISKSLNPDEAVAQGAAIYADMLLKAKLAQVRDESLTDVTPLSLGIESEGGLMSVIVPRNTPIPTKELSKTYSNVVDNQKTMSIRVYEGERTLVEDNNLLGEFQLDNIPEGPKGHIKIEVNFMVDANSILVVKACETSQGQENKIVIANSKGRLSDEEIERIRAEADEHRINDEKKREAVMAKHRLIQYCENMKTQINNNQPIFWISDDFKFEMLNAYDEAIKEAEMRPTFEKDWFVEKKDELENEYRSFINQLD